MPDISKKKSNFFVEKNYLLIQTFCSNQLTFSAAESDFRSFTGRCCYLSSLYTALTYAHRHTVPQVHLAVPQPYQRTQYATL